MRVTVAYVFSILAIVTIAGCNARNLEPVMPTNQDVARQSAESPDETTLADFQFTPNSGSTPAAKPHVFVTSSFRVESFFATDSGNATPQTSIFGMATNLGSPSGVFATANGAPFTGSAMQLLGWLPGTTGNASPTTKIAGLLTHMQAPEDVALDAAGNIYVADQGPSCNCIHVYAPGSTGNVAPIRTIAGPLTGLINPKGLAFDSNGNLWVATFTNGIREFAGSANGNVTPLRTITGVSFLKSVAIDIKSEILVTTNSKILVFAKTASGNASPIRTITDAMRDFGGIDTSVSGNIFVANSGVNGSQPEVDVYAANANGAPQPIRTIAGANTHLAGIFGVALQEPLQTAGIRLIGQSFTTDPRYGFILGFFNGTTSTTTQVVMLTANDPVQFDNVDSSLMHTAAFLGNATATGAPWPPNFTGGTVASPAGTSINTVGFTTGSLGPGQKSKIYNAGGPGFYMIGCQFHYVSSKMRNVIIVM